MHRFGVGAGFQRQMLGIVDVALDVAQRDRRALRQRHRQLMRGQFDLGISNDLVTMPSAKASCAVSTGDIRSSSRALALPSICVRR